MRPGLTSLHKCPKCGETFACSTSESLCAVLRAQPVGFKRDLVARHELDRVLVAWAKRGQVGCPMFVSTPVWFVQCHTAILVRTMGCSADKATQDDYTLVDVYVLGQCAVDVFDAYWPRLWACDHQLQ